MSRLYFFLPVAVFVVLISLVFLEVSWGAWILVGAATSALGEFVLPFDRLNVRERWSRRAVFSGVTLTVIAGLMDNWESEREQEAVKKQIEDTLIKTVENTDRQKELIKMVTGGNSIVWVDLVENQNQPNTFIADLVHEGDEVAAFDIDIEIVKTGNCDDIEPWTMGQALTSGVGNPRNQFIPALSPNSLKTLRGRFEPSCDQAYYLLFIQSRNRSIIEQILLKKSEGRWSQAIRLQELNADITLVTRTDQGFIEPNEEIKWPDLTMIRKALSLRLTN